MGAAVAVDDRPAVNSPEFFRRVKRYQADLQDTDAATAQTVALMVERIRASAGDPQLQRTAVAAVNQYRGGPLYMMSGRDCWSDPLMMADSCWWLAKTRVKFVHHTEHIARWWGEHDQLQLLISPEVLIQMERPEGDCAIFTMLICALLEVLGLPWEIVTAAVNPNQPAVYSHVWARVVLADGRRVDLDASHGDYPGWHVPQERQYKVQAWNESGRPVANAQSFEGLHGYVGMGDENPTVNLLELYPIEGAYPGATPSAIPQVYSQAPQSGGFDFGSLIGSLANQWTQIGSRVLAPSTTYQRNPDGSVSLVTPGSSPVLASSLLSTGTGGGSMLLYAGLGVGALVLVMMMGKK